MKSITINKKYQNQSNITIPLIDARLLVEMFDMIDSIMSQRSSKIEVEQVVSLDNAILGDYNEMVSVSSLGHIYVKNANDQKNRIVFENGISLLKSALAVMDVAPGESFKQVSLHHSHLGAEMAMAKIRKGLYSWNSVADGDIAWENEHGDIFTNIEENQIGLYKLVVNSKGRGFAMNSVSAIDGIYEVAYSRNLANDIGRDRFIRESSSFAF